MGNTQSGWDAAFYEDANGWKPVKDFLEGIRVSNPDEWNKVLNKFDMFGVLGWGESLKNGLLKPTEGKIFHIKVKGGEARVLGFGWDRLFIAAAAELKKTDELDPNTIRAAEERRQDWIGRFGDKT